MSPDIADRLFALLRDGTPGWGSANEGTLGIYWRTISRFADSVVAEAAIERIIGEWVSNTRPTPGYVRMMYQSEAARVAPPTRSLGGPKCYRCNDTAWVECTDDRRHAEWCRHRGTVYAQDGDCWCHAVVPCPACLSGNPQPPRPEDLRIPSFADARLMMSQGYVEECVHQGRDPNWDYFESIARSVFGTPEQT